MIRFCNNWLLLIPFKSSKLDISYKNLSALSLWASYQCLANSFSLMATQAENNGAIYLVKFWRPNLNCNISYCLQISLSFSNLCQKYFPVTLKKINFRKSKIELKIEKQLWNIKLETFLTRKKWPKTQEWITNYCLFFTVHKSATTS